jgi:hypothetical protein
LLNRFARSSISRSSISAASQSRLRHADRCVGRRSVARLRSGRRVDRVRGRSAHRLRDAGIDTDRVKLVVNQYDPALDLMPAQIAERLGCRWSARCPRGASRSAMPRTRGG